MQLFSSGADSVYDNYEKPLHVIKLADLNFFGR